MTKLFVCGCGHSGTSLVANILASHPAVFAPTDETNTFLDPATAPQRWGRLKREWKASGQVHLVEKTPRHVRTMHTIRAEVPGAKFLIVVRDPRAVVSSLMRSGATLNEAIARWVADNVVVAQNAGRPDTLVVRYEDIVVSHRKVLERICRFSLIPFDQQMLDYHKRPRQWFTSNTSGDLKELRNREINQPIYDARYRWRSELSPDDATAIVRSPKVKNLMRHFGYPHSIRLAMAEQKVRSLLPSRTERFLHPRTFAA